MPKLVQDNRLRIDVVEVRTGYLTPATKVNKLTLNTVNSVSHQTVLRTRVRDPVVFDPSIRDRDPNPGWGEKNPDAG